MKNYEYNGDLQQDIKTTKKKFDIKRFLKFEILAIISTLIASGGASLIFGFANFFRTVVIVLIVLTFANIKNIIKETKEEVDEIENKLADLYAEINEDSGKEFGKDLVKTRMKECVSQVSSVQKINSYDMDTLKKAKEEEKIITYFYLLDPRDQIQVLKQIRSIVTLGKAKREYYNLYLLNEKDIKEENINIPVQKTIKLNTK